MSAQFSLLLLTIAVQLLRSPETNALKCVQCDRRELYYDAERKKEERRRCLQGMTKPTLCVNSSMTHCLTNLYRKDDEETVTMRKCGTIREVVGCTVYRFPKKTSYESRESSTWHEWKKGRTSTDPPMEVVQVCAYGCTVDGCLIAASNSPHACDINNYMGLSLLLCTVVFPLFPPLRNR